MQSLKEMSKQVEAAPDKQVSLTDPGARSMATSGKGTGIVGYYVQMAVYAEHHLRGAHEVSERAQLTCMGQKARDATGCKEMRCWPASAAEFPLHSQDTDIWQRQARPLNGGRLHQRPTTLGRTATHARRASTFPGETCARTAGTISISLAISRFIRPACSNPDAAGKYKRLKRWEHEGVSTRCRTDRLDRMPDALTTCRQTVEHPSGMLKPWMGPYPFTD